VTKTSEVSENLGSLRRSQMALIPGFYIIEKSQLGRDIPRPRETMSIVAFLRAVRRREELPKEVCVIGLERLLYRTSDRRKAARVIQQALYNPLAVHHLRRQAPVVVLPLEYLELSLHWKAGIRRGRGVEEVFALEWVFPRADIRTVEETDVCYSMF